MLFKETVHEGTLDLIRRLMDDEHLNDFYLVGGTALSLMLGHRISIDVDLFTAVGFSGTRIADHLSKNYDTEIKTARDNYITGYINDVRFDMLSHQYRHVNPIVNLDGIRMSSLEDIAAMKINAIAGSGTRIKDFVDIYYLLREISYEQIMEAYSTKYPNTNVKQARMSLVHFNDIDFTTKVVLLDDVFKWGKIAKGILNASDQFDLMLKKGIKQGEASPVVANRRKKGLRP
jgi:hypothetical protein